MALSNILQVKGRVLLWLLNPPLLVPLPQVVYKELIGEGKQDEAVQVFNNRLH